MKHRLAMAHTWPYPLLLVPAFLAMALASCGKCLHLPCPFPMAVIVRVTAGSAAGSVNGAFIQVLGVTNPCTAQADASVCFVPGSAGTYELEVGAPGFQTAHRTITVHGTSAGECGCDLATTEYLAIALVASP